MSLTYLFINFYIVIIVNTYTLEISLAIKVIKWKWDYTYPNIPVYLREWVNGIRNGTDLKQFFKLVQ